ILCIIFTFITGSWISVEKRFASDSPSFGRNWASPTVMRKGKLLRRIHDRSCLCTGGARGRRSGADNDGVPVHTDLRHYVLHGDPSSAEEGQGASGDAQEAQK